MQINKINATPNFGAKLKITGVAKKYWNLSDNEIQQLCSKAEEIGTEKDLVTFHIGKYSEFNNLRMLNLTEFRNNVEGPLVGSSRKVTADINIDGNIQKYKFPRYVEGYSEKLKKPFKMLHKMLNRLTDYYPNEVHEQIKEQNLDKYRNLISNYKQNVQNFSDYLFNGDDAKKVTEHINYVKELDALTQDGMVDLFKLDNNDSKRLKQIYNYCFYPHSEFYVREIITRAITNEADKYLEIRKNPAEFAKLQEKQDILLKMSERK